MEISIRPLEIEDAYISVKWRNDPEVFKYTGNTYKEEITIEKELDWIKNVIRSKSDKRYAILAGNIYIGNIYLTDITTESAFFHIFIGEKKFWGKGFAKKASLLIINYAFKDLMLHKINLKVRNQNERALKLYQDLGFKIISRDSEFLNMQLENTNL